MLFRHSPWQIPGGSGKVTGNWQDRKRPENKTKNSRKILGLEVKLRVPTPKTYRKLQLQNAMECSKQQMRTTPVFCLLDKGIKRIGKGREIRWGRESPP